MHLPRHTYVCVVVKEGWEHRSSSKQNCTEQGLSRRRSGATQLQVEGRQS